MKQRWGLMRRDHSRGGRLTYFYGSVVDNDEGITRMKWGTDKDKAKEFLVHAARQFREIHYKVSNVIAINLDKKE